MRTASGATAVQIAESVGGRRRIVRHVGSARDEGELGLLIEQANRLLARDAQHVLDLGLTPVAPKAVMVPAPTRELFPRARGERRWVRRAHVLKTSSGLLYEALAGVYTGLGFDAIGDEVFRDLVIARVVEPTSLLDVDRVLAELGRASASLSTRKRTLRRPHRSGRGPSPATLPGPVHAGHGSGRPSRSALWGLSRHPRSAGLRRGATGVRRPRGCSPHRTGPGRRPPQPAGDGSRSIPFARSSRAAGPALAPMRAHGAAH